MNIFKAIQICCDIENLYQNKELNNMIPWNYSNFYQIRIPKNNGATTIIESNRTESHFSATEFVPATFWTNLFGTAGNFATIPTTFTVKFNNDGSLPHATMEPNSMIHGLAARIIYNKMRKAYLDDWHATLRIIHREKI